MSQPNIPSPLFSEGSIKNIRTDDEAHLQRRWYVLRDLKRPNAQLPAYKMLLAKEFEVFTPMKWQVSVYRGKRVREEVPVLRDLLFVHSAKSELDPVVEHTPTLQYRYLKGGGYREPMVVCDKEMERFMLAVCSADLPVYYSPEEITPDMLGRTVRVIGGPLDGYEATLLKRRGSKKKRILVELSTLIAASVEVEPEYLQLI